VNITGDYKSNKMQVFDFVCEVYVLCVVITVSSVGNKIVSHIVSGLG